MKEIDDAIKLLAEQMTTRDWDTYNLTFKNKHVETLKLLLDVKLL